MKTTASRASAVSQTRGFGDLLYDKAGSRPSLDLDFAGTSSLRDKITGEYLVDHTRASTGTYIDSEGLVKTAPINLLTQSVDFNSGWLANVTRTTGFVAPDGTQTAVRIQIGTGASKYLKQQLTNLTQGKTYTFSIHIKKHVSDNQFKIIANSNGGLNQSSDYTAPTEWTRYSVTFTADSGSSHYVGIDNPAANTSVDVLAWGAQLEEGSTATEYIKTTSTINTAPRFTHERVETGNIVLNSERFISSDWDKGTGGVTVEPNYALSPDNKFSATRLNLAASSATWIKQDINLVNGKTYTFSIYVKDAGNSSNFEQYIYKASVVSVNTGQIAASSDWTRYSQTFTATANGAYQFGIKNGNDSYTTDVLIWGAQVEEADSETTYVPSIDTFTSRASSATYVDSAGLVKTAYKNEVPYSEDFTNWGKMTQDSVVSNVAIAPDGTQTADKLILGNYNHWAHAWTQSISPSELGTLSVYAKYIEGSMFTHLVLGRQSDNQYYALGASFNLTNGTIQDIKGDANGDHCTASIENVGNGWYRCSVFPTPGSASATRSQTNYYISPHRSDNSPDNVYYYRPTNNYGNGTDGLLVWGGMQNNNVTEAGDYVKTGATASGGPRYSHDPETLTPTGLYLEPATTNYWHDSNLNYLKTSSYTSNIHGGYTYNLTITPNAVTAPDGTQTAALVVPRSDVGANQEHWFQQNQGVTTAGSTFSCFVKYNGWRYISIRNGHGANDTALFDLLNGTFVGTDTTTTVSSAKIEPYPNGWYRISSTRLTTGVGWSSLIFRPTGDLNVGVKPTSSIAPDGVSGIYIWGIQWEANPYSSAVIISSGNDTTRAADVYTSTPNLTETFEPRGLLIGEARTNILHYSSNPVNNWNAKGSSTTVTANYATAPDGTNTAVRIQMPATSGTFFKHLTSGFSSGTVYTASFWGKSNGQPKIDLIGGPGGTATVFTLSDRWERYTLTWTSSGTSANFGFDNGATPFAVDALVWGMQVEAGSFATSYIPTTGNNQATRAADVVSINGDNFGTYRTNKVLKTEHIWDWTVWNPVLGSNESSIKVVTPYAYPNPIDGKYNAALVHRHSTDYYFIQNINVTYPLTIGYSIYVKPVSNPCIIQLFTQSSQQGRANFDLINKTHGGDGTRNITEVGDGWLKLEWTTPTHTSNPSSVSISLTSDSLTTSRGTGTGTNVKFYVYAPQVEDNSITNYIPSTDTFTSRLGNATYVDSNGLIKTAYRNLVVYSNEIGNNLGWIKSNLSATVNNSTAPDGTQTATLLIPNTTNTDSHFTYQTVGYQNGAMSLHVKSAGMSHVSLIHQPANAPTEACGVSVNLNNGTIHATDNATGEIIDEGNGWYRVIVKPTTSVQARYFIIQPNNGEQPNDNNRFRVVYAGNGTDGVYVWGAMQTDNANDAGEYTANLTNVLSAPPRYSHDPETLVPTGLYLEPSATNSWLSSNLNSSHTDTYTNNIPGGYTYNLRITPNATTAPDGTETAALVVPREDVGSGQEHWFQRNHGITNISTFSCFFKYNGWRYVSVRNGHVGNTTLLVDLLNGTIVGTSNPTNVLDYKIEAYANGWYRVSSTCISAGNNGWSSIVFFENATIPNNTTIPSHTSAPDGVSGVYIWGLQIEAGSYSSSVIVTNGTSVTRAADTYTSTATTVFDRDGGNKEAWYNHYGPQTYLLEHQRPKGEWKRIWIVGTDNNNGSFSQIATQVFWRGSATQPERQFIVDAGIQFQFMPTLSDQTHNYKYGVAMDVNDAQSFDNGALTGTDTSVILPTGIQTNMPDKITIGVVGNNPTTYMSSPFARITYWKTRLPNTSLIQISNK